MRRELEAKHKAIICIIAALALFVAASAARYFLVVVPEQQAEDKTDITAVEDNKGDVSSMPADTQGLYSELIATDWASGDGSTSYSFSTTQVLAGDEVSDFSIDYVVDLAGIGIDTDSATGESVDGFSKIVTISIGGESYDAAFYPATDKSPAIFASRAFEGGYIVPSEKTTFTFKGLDQLHDVCGMDSAEAQELVATVARTSYPTVTCATFAGDAASDLKSGCVLAHVTLNDDAETTLTLRKSPTRDNLEVYIGSTNDFTATGFTDLDDVRTATKN